MICKLGYLILAVGIVSALAQSPEGPLSRLIGPALLAWTSPAMDAVSVLDTDVALAGSSVIGILFSASWCSRCKQFVPLLEEFYHRMNQKGNIRFNIVWVSINKYETEEEFFHYYRSMPWFAVPQDQIPVTLENTADVFRLTGIPHLVLLDAADGSIISLDGGEKLINDKYGVEFPWKPHSLLSWVPFGLKTTITSLASDVKSRLTAALHPKNVFLVARDIVVGATMLVFRLTRTLYNYIAK